MNGDATFVEELLAAGADVNAQNPQNGKTAVYMAVGDEDLDIMKTLIKAGAETWSSRWCSVRQARRVEDPEECPTALRALRSRPSKPNFKLLLTPSRSHESFDADSRPPRM